MLHIKAVHPYARQRKKKYFEDVHPCHSRITFKYAANFQFPGIIQPSDIFNVFRYYALSHFIIGLGFFDHHHLHQIFHDMFPFLFYIISYLLEG